MFRDHGCWEIFILVYDLVLTVALTHNLCTKDWSVLSDVHLDLSASLKHCHDRMSHDHRLDESHGELAEILMSSHVLSTYRASHCSTYCLCPDSFNISTQVAAPTDKRFPHMCMAEDLIPETTQRVQETSFSLPPDSWNLSSEWCLKLTKGQGG